VTEIRQIVAGLDLAEAGEPSPGCHLALEVAEWAADHWRAALTLVHSHHGEERPRALADSREVSAARERLRARSIETHAVQKDETPWRALCAEAAERRADLVVAGKRTSHGHDGRRLGSVSFNLLRHCACPVWVTKPGMPALPRAILAATDRSAVGERVVAWAASVAEATGAELHVVHSLQLPMEVQMRGSGAEEEWYERTRAEARAELSAQVSAAGLPGKVGIHVGLTSPTHAVLDGCERLSPELLVMGTISRSGIAGRVVGNTAERLLGRVECSILAVKPEGFVSEGPG
jgi:nucleotide-binding universal stress UspA family protein